MKLWAFTYVFTKTHHFINSKIRIVMKKRLLMLSVLALVILCSNVALTKEQVRDVPSFSGVALKIPGTVYLSQEGPQSVRVVANEPVLEELVTEVKNNTLVIRFKNNNLFRRSFNYGKIQVYITVPDIEALSISGSGSIEGSTIKSQNINLTISGSGGISVSNLNSERVKAIVSGSGTVWVNEGIANEFSSTISGSGSIKAGDFETAIANITISGSGNCTINAQKSLKARVTGSGDIAYKGSPQLDTNITGSGRIKKL